MGNSALESRSARDSTIGSIVNIGGGQFYFVKEAIWSLWKCDENSEAPNSTKPERAYPSKKVPNAYDVNLSHGTLTATVLTLPELQELCEANDLEMGDYTSKFIDDDGEEYVALQILKFSPWNQTTSEPPVEEGSTSADIDEEQSQPGWFARWWKKRGKERAEEFAEEVEVEIDHHELPGFEPPFEDVEAYQEYDEPDPGYKSTPLFMNRSLDPICEEDENDPPEEVTVIPPKGIASGKWVKKLANLREEVESGTSCEEDVPAEEASPPEGIPQQWSRFQIESEHDDQLLNVPVARSSPQARSTSRRPKKETRSPAPGGSASVRRRAKRLSPTKRPASKRRRQMQESPPDTPELGVTVPRNK